VENYPQLLEFQYCISSERNASAKPLKTDRLETCFLLAAERFSQDLIRSDNHAASGKK
jgi:hypothetical protein